MRSIIHSCVSRLFKSARWLLPVLGLVLLIGPFVPPANLLPATLGAMALIGMSASLAIAGRGPWLDRRLGGPDKAYALHRIAGYVAVAALAGHWVLASPVGRGVVPPLADLGESAGVFAGSGIMILAAIAALRIIPHHWWRASHWLMGPLFAVSVFHTFFSASPLPELSPPWLVLAGASLFGLWGWLRTLTRKKHSAEAVVSACHRLTDAVEFEVTSQTPLAPFVPGQFQTITVPGLSAEPHPFSIAGASTTSRRFGVRVSGDWTASLYDRIKVGDRVVLGAPQGRFTPRFDANRPAQLWVAGGAGITPFLSVLQAMDADDAAPVTLIYSYRGQDDAIGLDTLAAAQIHLPQLRLVLIDSNLGTRMTDTHVRDALAALPRKSDLYMCGPDGMKMTAERVYREMGMTGAVRHEEFDFRAARSLRDIAALASPLLRPVAVAARRIGHWARDRIKQVLKSAGTIRRFTGRMAS
jgi:predicted ferric reductase